MNAVDGGGSLQTLSVHRSIMHRAALHMVSRFAPINA
jgi:hypothetical protein